MINKFDTPENGFSLLELVVACAVVIIISGASYLIIPNIISNSQTKTDAYEQCNLQRESEITTLMNGDEPSIKSTCSPTATPTP